MKKSSLYVSKRPAWDLFYRAGAAAILSLLISSCAVLLVGPYDEITDKAITDLETKTEQFLAKMESSGGDYESNKSFYQDAKAGVRAIRLRAELYGRDKNKGELDDIDRLDQAFGQLAELHQAGPLTGRAGTIARSLIETNFQALMQIELAKKRSSGISAPKTN